MLKGFIELNKKEYFFYTSNDELFLTIFNQKQQELIDEFFSCYDKEEVPFTIQGRVMNSSNTVLFFIRSQISKSIGEYIFKISSYIEHEANKEDIQRLSIYSKELDWFYSLNKSYMFELTYPTGEVNFSVNPIEKNTDSFNFILDEKIIEGKLSIARSVSKQSNNPISLNSVVTYTFGDNCEYLFLIKIVKLTKEFIRIITYRGNISINQVILEAKSKSGKYRKVGKIVFFDNMDTKEESAKYIKNRIINFDILQSGTAELFQLLASNQLYKEHIPQNSKDKNLITPARFVLITAAFEWEFRSAYGEIKETENSSFREVRSSVIEYINDLIESSTGKKKKYARSLHKIVSNSSMSLSEKILRALNDSEGVIGKFIVDLYGMNAIENIKYPQIAERIQNQRNNYAHGNIDRELNFVVILDLLVLEWTIYVLILRKAKLTDNQIFQAINKLFARNY